jgi:hypothetical protein
LTHPRLTRDSCRFVELTKDTQELDLQQLAELVTPRTRLVSMVHVSNMLGCITPAQRIVEIARSVGAKVRTLRRTGSTLPYAQFGAGPSRLSKEEGLVGGQHALGQSFLGCSHTELP